MIDIITRIDMKCRWSHDSYRCSRTSLLNVLLHMAFMKISGRAFQNSIACTVKEYRKQLLLCCGILNYLFGTARFLT